VENGSLARAFDFDMDQTSPPGSGKRFSAETSAGSQLSLLFQSGEGVAKPTVRARTKNASDAVVGRDSATYP